jgi:uncharacterized NAD(P)/FAD-binding protein YdhS
MLDIGVALLYNRMGRLVRRVQEVMLRRLTPRQVVSCAAAVTSGAVRPIPASRPSMLAGVNAGQMFGLFIVGTIAKAIAAVALIRPRATARSVVVLSSTGSRGS